MFFAFRIAASAAFFGLLLLSAQPADAREIQLGAVTYDARPERQVINVGGEQLRGIRFEVRQSDVDVQDIKVVYGDGLSEDIRVRQVFRAGSSSRVFELAAPRRNVKQVIVTFSPMGPAKLVFFGVSSGAEPAADWVRLGCKDVRFFVDRDTLKVGIAEGRFNAIRLRVRYSPIEVFSLRVTFGNGSRQDVRVNEFIPAGGGTRPINLAGSNRGIDRIELIYRSIPTNKGSAEVCIDGLKQ